MEFLLTHLQNLEIEFLNTSIFKKDKIFIEIDRGKLDLIYNEKQK